MRRLAIIILAGLVLHPFAARAEDAAVARGRYAEKLADCSACHTVPGGRPFAGGFPLVSPLGTIYTTNITPDSAYGIGKYSYEDFAHALRQGVAKDGHHLYPAMPYPSYVNMTDEDLRDLYAYFMHAVAPVPKKPRETKLPFPFSQRWALPLWNLAFARHDAFKPRADRDAAWNRGAYLVQTLGHCGACHTPRNFAYQERAYDESSSVFLAGGVADNWNSSNLRGDNATGLGRWTEEDIAEFLQTGHAPGGTAFGSMKPVVENSGQYLTAEDRAAIAHYLKSLPPRGEEASYEPPVDPGAETAALLSGAGARPGAGLYLSACASCHQASGAGRTRNLPALAGNTMVMAGDTSSIIRIVLEGSVSPRTAKGQVPAAMPAFGKGLTDREIAEILTFIRREWGNDAAPVTERGVSVVRAKLRKDPKAKPGAK